MTSSSFQPTHEISLDLGGSGRWTFFARLLGSTGWTRGAWGGQADLYRENGKDWFWRCREGARPFAVTVRTLLGSKLLGPTGVTDLPLMTMRDLRTVAETLEENEAIQVLTLRGKKLGMLLRRPVGGRLVRESAIAVNFGR
ncbi:MAG TPA: hypothetical protein PLC99_22610 [Verrucomicrobiota bacterium]|nr:hypothetical protein [Verrucomicrobiota bacterium]